MSKGIKKALPYIIVLLLLAAVAVFTGDYLSFDMFGNDDEAHDSVELPVDSVVIEEVVPADTTLLDTGLIEADPELASQTSIKEWRLVVASLPSKEHAERVAGSLGGGTSVMYVEYLDTYRVVYNSYGDLPEAQNAFDEVSEQYPTAWLVYF